MNTNIELICTGHGAERRLDLAARWLRGFEGRFSRFLPESELSALNASAGGPFAASPMLFALVERAIDFARSSGGLFDPTVLRRLMELGYDRSFELVGESPIRRHDCLRDASWRDLQLDPSRNTIVLPPGMGIDLGGIGKGWAVDRVVCILGEHCLVNCGGDVYARGKPAATESWRVGITDPFNAELDLMVLSLTDTAVATSSVLRRRWGAAGALHHIIDPRTGMPSDSDALQVTVVAPSAALADYHAKVALLLGAEAGMQHLNHVSDIEGLAVSGSGTLFQTEGFPAYVTA